MLHGTEDAGADVKSAMMWAAKCGHVQCLDFLIQMGVDVNGKRGEFTPLMFASKNGHTDCVVSLVRARSRCEQFAV